VENKIRIHHDSHLESLRLERFVCSILNFEINLYETTQLFTHRIVGAIHESPLPAGDLHHGSPF
jgi:hypothetical protein